MPKKRPAKKREAPSSERFIHGEVESWHVLMVAHDKSIEVPPHRAQYEEQLPGGGCRYTRRSVSDHFCLEMNLVFRGPVRDHSRMQFSISEWDAEEYGGIAGELSYDKESGMRGGVHMSGSFPHDLYQLLLSGARVVLAIETGEGFSRRKARIRSLAFSDSGHPQWIDEDCGLI